MLRTSPKQDNQFWTFCNIPLLKTCSIKKIVSDIWHCKVKLPSFARGALFVVSGVIVVIEAGTSIGLC